MRSSTRRGRLGAMRGSHVKKRNSTSDALLDVALEYFSTKAYAEVTIQEIANQSNLTYSLVYYYYRNKEDLFQSAVSHSIEKAIENYNSLKEKHVSPVDLINDWLESNIRQSESLKRLVKIMFEFSAKRDGSPSVAKEVEYFYMFERTLLADSIRLGVEQGLFKCASPENTAAFVSTHIDGIFHGALVRPELDIESAMNNLRATLWSLLEFQPHPDLTHSSDTAFISSGTAAPAGHGNAG